MKAEQRTSWVQESLFYQGWCRSCLNLSCQQERLSLSPLLQRPEAICERVLYQTPSTLEGMGIHPYQHWYLWVFHLCLKIFCQHHHPRAYRLPSPSTSSYTELPQSKGLILWQRRSNDGSLVLSYTMSPRSNQSNGMVNWPVERSAKAQLRGNTLEIGAQPKLW